MCYYVIRADYGLLKYLLKGIKVFAPSQLLYVSFIFLLFHGMTIKEIIDDGFKIDEKVIESKIFTAINISISIIQYCWLCKHIRSLNPDAVLILETDMKF